MRFTFVLVAAVLASCSGARLETEPHHFENAPVPASTNERNLARNRAAIHSSAANENETAHLVTDGVYPGSKVFDRDGLASKWTSGAGSPQWVYVDLGQPSTFDRVKLYWGANFPRAYTLETSPDAKTWTPLYTTASSDGGLDDIGFASSTGRYVRFHSDLRPPLAGFSLFELEVYGAGGATTPPPTLRGTEPDGTQTLSGGNWRVERASRVIESMERVSELRYDDRSWLAARVPGTVLTSYLDLGAVPDPNFGDQQTQISDAFFTADFVYRDTFAVPASYCKRRVFLNFDGVNWKADVFVNGASAGKIEGAFQRAHFDVTAHTTCGGENAIAVYVHRNDHPGRVKAKTLASAGPNGGILGADNPTIHASIGWDWVPTVRGRDTGIQDPVWLSASGDVTLADPFVVTKLPLPKTAPADLTVSTDLVNHSTGVVSAVLEGRIEPGGIVFSKPVTLGASSRTTVKLDALSLANPALWWPNGYGPQNLYTLSLKVTAAGSVSDTKTTRFGVRQITAETKDNALTLRVNGRRIFVRGGNWGMSESLLRLDDEGYDVRVRLHKEQNFTMIRNWIGMTSNDAFYDACDRYGILVWDDFWLANPFDGPEPKDAALFMENAKDKIRRVRGHPSVALYCGRNEGPPPDSLAQSLETAVAELDGSRPYVPNSAAGTVDGGGPYSVRDPIWYFEHAGPKIHSEVGMPAVPSADSMRQMLPAEHLWPIDEMWGVHDFCDSAQGASSYTAYITERYGAPSGIDDYCKKAQATNLENYRAIFEGYASAGRNGALLWMSQSVWPSTVWQTYDYYLEPTGAYFGAKHASEPLHILWDAHTEEIKVTNNSARAEKRLVAEAKLYALDGTEKYSRSFELDAPLDSVKSCFKLAYPRGLSATHFIRLRLLRGTDVVSDSFYWRGTTYEDYTALGTLPKVALNAGATLTGQGGTRTVKTTITNPGPGVAFMVRVKLLRAPSGERVLPVFFSDNYVSLLPGETKDVTAEFDEKYLAGEQLRVALEGYNVDPVDVPLHDAR